jgi:hypothetical protein
MHVLQRERHIEVKDRIGIVGRENVVEKEQGTQDLHQWAIVFYFLANKAILHVDHQAVKHKLKS